MSNIRHGNARGLTLVEVLVVIAIVAILSGLAAPSFVNMTQRFRVTAHASTLMGAMTFARSEAIKRGLPVSLCASANGTSCLGANTWEKGWIIFTDPNASLTIGSILKVQAAVKNSDTVSANNSVSSLTFSRDGFTMALPASLVTFTLQTVPANTAATQCIAVSRTGRMQTLRAGTGSCA